MNIRAVFLLSLFLLLAACTAAPPDVAPPTPAVAPSATALPATPTTAPTPTPEPTATPTLTADQLRDQRTTAVLLTLPGYDPAHHDALLPLARHLWGDEDVIDPADLAIVVGETAVRVNAAASDSYPPGTLFLWRGAELLLLLPAAPDQTTEPGQVTLLGETVQTWVAYDEAGTMARFLHPTAAQWITPLDLSETGGFNLFLAQDIFPDGQPGAATVWWANGGQTMELTTSPIPDQSLPDYLTATQHQLTQTTVEDQQLSAIAAPDGTIQYTYNAEDGTWTEALNPAEAFYAQAQELYGEYGITLDPNVETGPNGELTIYATNDAGNRYIAVRSALDQDGKIVPVFAVESHIAANSVVISGGDFITPNGVQVSFRRMKGVELPGANIEVKNLGEFTQGLDELFPLPPGTCVINTSRVATASQPYTCFSDEGGADKVPVPTLNNVLVVVGNSRQPIPGTRDMIVGSYYDGNTKTRYSYYWNPNQPDILVVHVNMDPNLIVPVTDPRNKQRVHYGGVLDAQNTSLIYMQLNQDLRPTNANPVANNANNQPTSIRRAGNAFMQSIMYENVTMEKR